MDLIAVDWRAGSSSEMGTTTTANRHSDVQTKRRRRIDYLLETESPTKSIMQFSHLDRV